MVGPSATQMLKYQMQLLSRSLEKHPPAVTISLWNTFLLSHHSCSYNTTTLCHTISLRKWEILPFPTSFLCFPLCEQTPSTPPHFSHQTDVPQTEWWYLFCAVFQQWEAEVDLCFGSSAGRTRPPGMPWWDCSPAAAMGAGCLAGVTVRGDTPEGFQGRILGVL